MIFTCLFTIRVMLFYIAPAGAQQLYYLHPDVSFFKGNGFKQLGPYLDMPDNSSAGDVWNPPDTESTSGISYDNCEAPPQM
mmetsp:Transcript_62675/g.91895  ORF Transcript_62675/g.91895 Transcript_62675/m.91895 type:complete len:81 (+) Transcript_62675:7-249(+)